MIFRDQSPVKLATEPRIVYHCSSDIDLRDKQMEGEVIPLFLNVADFTQRRSWVRVLVFGKGLRRWCRIVNIQAD